MTPHEILAESRQCFRQNPNSMQSARAHWQKVESMRPRQNERTLCGRCCCSHATAFCRQCLPRTVSYLTRSTGPVASQPVSATHVAVRIITAKHEVPRGTGRYRVLAAYTGLSRQATAKHTACLL